ncbi:MAG: arginyltransferase [Pseudomonadales bacterium]|nr:arginyltransferase [Pseudomonadales bacterium]
MSSVRELKFYSTAEHACSYLDNRQASTLFADPQSTMSAALYGELSDLGFRRSGNFVYRPHCQPCQACIPVRIPVACFKPNRSQRRVWAMNQDLDITTTMPGLTEERYDLYDRYIRHRHADGDMFPPSVDQFVSFLQSAWSDTCFIEFRLHGQLVAVAVCDWLPHGMSATYTFFEPQQATRSLGTFAILWQIEECRRMQHHAVYLGYWIKQSAKMRYKSVFRPMEMLIHDEWLMAK